jgi:hypothetical protein
MKNNASHCRPGRIFTELVKPLVISSMQSQLAGLLHPDCEKQIISKHPRPMAVS